MQAFLIASSILTAIFLLNIGYPGWYNDRVNIKSSCHDGIFNFNSLCWQYLKFYRYGDALLLKLAETMK